MFFRLLPQLYSSLFYKCINFFQHNFEDYKFYTFEPVTLVPFQTKLIDISLMSQDQVSKQ